MSDNTSINFELKFIADDLKKDVTAAKGSLKDLSDAFKKALSSTTVGKGNKYSDELKAARTQIKGLISEIRQLQAAGKKNLNIDVAPKKRAQIMGGAANAEASIRAAAPASIEKSKTKEKIEADREAKKAEQEKAKATRESTAAYREQTKAIEAINQKITELVFRSESMAKHAITLRYALYDVAAVSGQAAGTLLNFGKNIIMAGAAQERSFTQVEKTLNGIGAGATEKLKQDLIDLSTQVPVTFDEISKIAMLGSQMGVGEKGLASFTDTVAKFSAITGVSSEQAAQGMGKIANLLGLVNKDSAGHITINGDAVRYLGAAIAKTGVTSSATEQEIMNTTQQIGAIGTQAGLTASQVVGLSSSLASMGIRPEEARGVTVQLFNAMSSAAQSFIPTIDKGNEKLRIFAEVAGTSASKFAAAWSNKDALTSIKETNGTVDNASEAFSAFAKGLGSYDIPSTLKKLGLDGIRTSKGLTSMAAGFALMSDQMKIAKEAGQAVGANGMTFLDKSFGKKANDLSSKLEMLSNSFTALFASMSDNEVVNSSIGFLADSVKFLSNGLRNLTKDPVGKWVSSLGILVTLLGGAILGIIAIVAKAGGSMLAFRTAISNAAISGIGFNGTLMKLVGGMAGLDAATMKQIGTLQAEAIALREAQAAATATTVAEGELAVGAATSSIALQAAGESGKKAAVGVKIFGMSVKTMLTTTGVGLLVLILGAVVGAFMEAGDAASGVTPGLDEAQQGFIDTGKEAAALRQELQDLLGAVLDISDTTRGLNNNLYRMGNLIRDNNNVFKSGTQAARDFEEQNNSFMQSAINVYGSDKAKLAGYLTNYLAFLMKMKIGTKSAYLDIQAYINSLNVKPDLSIGFDPTALIEGLQQTKKDLGSATKQAKTLLEYIQEALRLLNAKTAMNQSIRDLGATLEETGKSFDNLTNKGAQSLDSLGSAIESIVSASDGTAQKTANRLGALRLAMWQSGVTAKAAYVMIDKAIYSTGKKAKVSGADVEQYFQQLSAGMASAVQKNVKSIRDWASEVAGVVSDAFDIRFEKQQEFDKITKMWSGLTTEVNDANDAIKEIQSTLDDLKSNKNVIEYQLKVAKKYGDTLREAALQAKLDKTNEDITKSQQDMQKQLDKTNKTLTGNGTVAIENRANVLDLVKAYQGYLKTIAATTTDQGKLSAAAIGMQADFVAQGKALGYSQDELKQYADAIGVDFLTATNNIPKDITLDLANTDPIVAALAAFVSKANAELDKIKIIDISGNTVNVNANANASTKAPVGGSAPATGATTPYRYSGGPSNTAAFNSSSGGTSNPSTPKKGLNNTSLMLGNTLINPGVVTNNGATTSTPAVAAATTAAHDAMWSDIFTSLVRGDKNGVRAMRGKLAGGAMALYDGLYANGSFTPYGSLGSHTEAEAIASRLGKKKPTDMQITSFRAGEKKYLDEIKTHENRGELEQFWMESAHDTALMAIQKKYKMNDFVKSYGLGFATGGLVRGPGSNTSDSIPARLSNNEFVIQANAVRHYGADFMSALNNLQIPVSRGGNGGGMGGVVYLSPDDRALLRAAIDRPIALYTDNARIAQSANAGNVELARRGKN